MRVSARVLKLAKQYAMLDKEHGQADMNAAIDLARAVVRLAKQPAARPVVVES